MAVHPPWEFIFGILGIICSFLVSLSRLEPIYLICKKKTSEGFQGIPDVIALFSAMLRLLYALFQKDTCLLNTINTINTINYVTSLIMEILYLAVYLFYATKKDWDLTWKFILLFNIFGFGLIAGLTLFLTQGETRVEVLGWICMVVSLCVFVESLFIVEKVIKTKTVEYMSFFPSFFLTLSAVMWFGYGYLKKDKFIIIPNILGFIFGILQMVLYMMYRNSKKIVIEANLAELNSPAIGNEVNNV